MLFLKINSKPPLNNNIGGYKLNCMSAHDHIVSELNQLLIPNPKNNNTPTAEIYNWVAVHCQLPPTHETVWLLNAETGFVALGNLESGDDGWCWLLSNGELYTKDGKIVAECDTPLDGEEPYIFTHWHRLPRPFTYLQNI